MTISATIHYAPHEGRTKFYRIVQFERNDGANLTLFNYGRVGMIGQIDVQSNASAMADSVNAKIREKSKRGYTFQIAERIQPCVLQDSRLPHLIWMRQEIREFFAGDGLNKPTAPAVITPKPVQKERNDPLWGSW